MVTGMKLKSPQVPSRVLESGFFNLGVKLHTCLIKLHKFHRPIPKTRVLKAPVDSQ